MLLRRSLFALSAALLLAPTPSHADSVVASQVDWGLYDIEIDDPLDPTKTQVIGFVEVHDVPVTGAPPQRHEHWYVDPTKWVPDPAEFTFRYHQGPLGHGKRPEIAATGKFDHYGFLVTPPPRPLVEKAASTTPGPADCTGRHLCAGYTKLKNNKDQEFGTVNIWTDAAGNLHELYILNPTVFVPPSPTACRSEWRLTRFEPDLKATAPASAEPNEKLTATGTSTWDLRWAREVPEAPGSAREPGTINVKLIASPPVCQ